MVDRFVSKVKWFNARRGHGFLQPIEEGGEDIFVHYSFIEPEKDGYKVIQKNQTVEFDLVVMENDKKQAHNIKILD